jgi:hypothetical protein
VEAEEGEDAFGSGGLAESFHPGDDPGLFNARQGAQFFQVGY